MSYKLPVVREIVDPKTGRPVVLMGTDPVSQRELVMASLLSVPAPQAARALRRGWQG